MTGLVLSGVTIQYPLHFHQAPEPDSSSSNRSMRPGAGFEAEGRLSRYRQSGMLRSGRILAVVVKLLPACNRVPVKAY